MESTLKIGDKVKIGDKIGEAMGLKQRGGSTIIKVAFEEGPAKDIVSPPTKKEKIFSPIEQIKNRQFDSPIHFDLHYEAIRLSLAWVYEDIILLFCIPHHYFFIILINGIHIKMILIMKNY